MARNPIKKRKATVDAGSSPSDIPVIRGDVNIKPPTPAEIERMKREQFKRKYPHTSA